MHELAELWSTVRAARWDQDPTKVLTLGGDDVLIEGLARGLLGGVLAEQVEGAELAAPELGVRRVGPAVGAPGRHPGVAVKRCRGRGDRRRKPARQSVLQ